MWEKSAALEQAGYRWRLGARNYPRQGEMERQASQSVVRPKDRSKPRADTRGLYGELRFYTRLPECLTVPNTLSEAK